MSSIPQVCLALQTVLTTVANTAARTSGFIRRQRQVTGAGFVQALVFGFLANPQATLEQLAQSAANVGIFWTCRISTFNLKVLYESRIDSCVLGGRKPMEVGRAMHWICLGSQLETTLNQRLLEPLRRRWLSGVSNWLPKQIRCIARPTSIGFRPPKTQLSIRLSYQ